LIRISLLFCDEEPDLTGDLHYFSSK
jgi:hypothetical protein